LLFNLVNAEQMQVVYTSVGLNWEEARAAIMEAFGDAERREGEEQRGEEREGRRHAGNWQMAPRGRNRLPDRRCSRQVSFVYGWRP